MREDSFERALFSDLAEKRKKKRQAKVTKKDHAVDVTTKLTLTPLHKALIDGKKINFYYDIRSADKKDAVELLENSIKMLTARAISLGDYSCNYIEGSSSLQDGEIDGDGGVVIHVIGR